MPIGMSVFGPHTATSAPQRMSPQISERATREWRTSPTMHTRRPAIEPSRSRIVSRSRSACVGCSCWPSPALMTFDGIRSARNCAAPEEPCRITTMSIRIASRLRAVSTRLSPFSTEEPDEAMLTVSALRRFSANSKEIRVRVEGSRKRLTMVFPRRTGTFLMRRSLISLNGSAVSRIPSICSQVSCWSPVRSFPRPSPSAPPFVVLAVIFSFRPGRVERSARHRCWAR